VRCLTLSTLNYVFSSGPDSVPLILLYNCRRALTKPIHHLYNFSLKSGIFPEAWKMSFGTLIWKSGDRSLLTNYRSRYIEIKLQYPKTLREILEPKWHYSLMCLLVNNMDSVVLILR